MPDAPHPVFDPAPLIEAAPGMHTDDDSAPDGMLAYAMAIANPDPNDPNWPLPSFDAVDWAAAFCKRFPDMDEGTMLGWFANALMRGYDEHARKQQARIATDAAEIKALREALRKARSLLASVGHDDDCEQSLIDAWTASVAEIDRALLSERGE